MFADAAGSARDGTSSEGSSSLDRVFGVAGRYVLHVETVLATLVVVLGLLAVLALFVGVVMGMPMGPPPDPGEPDPAWAAETVILVGLVVLGGALLSSTGLAVALLAHVPLEFRDQEGDGRSPPNVVETTARNALYYGLRALGSLAALVFLAAIGVGLLLTGGSIAFDSSTGIPSGGLFLVLVAVATMIAVVYLDVARTGIGGLFAGEDGRLSSS